MTRLRILIPASQHITPGRTYDVAEWLDDGTPMVRNDRSDAHFLSNYDYLALGRLSGLGQPCGWEPVG